MSRTRAVSPALHVLFFLSGAASLGYQLVWTKMFATGLGHEMPALLAIVCAFMAGMAMGSACIDRYVPRSAKAGKWLAALEWITGAWAIAGSLFIPHVNELALRLIGLSPTALHHWAVAFVLPGIVLLPATAAMGASLPVMEKFLWAVTPRRASIGSIYAANTLGAAAGTLLTPHLLMPAFGFSKSCWLLALMNVLAGTGALVLSFAATNPVRESRPVAPASSFSAARLALTLFFTGILGIAYETAAVRVLGQVLKNTVFTYAAILSVFLFGTAAGAAAYHRWWQAKEPRRLLAALLCATGASCFVGVLMMKRAPWLYAAARKFGDSPAQVCVAELLTAFGVLALPTFFMGATFSQLATGVRATMGRIGMAVAINTIGAAFAPVLGGVILIPAIGSKWSLLLIAMSYLSLLPARPNGKLAVTCIVACAGAAFANLHIVTVPPGARVIDYREGTMASVAVVEDGNSRVLRVDNSFQMGGTAPAATDAEYRQAHLPLLLHGSAHRALFLGLGTGISYGAAALYPGLKADGAELLPEIVNVMHYFAPQNFSPGRQPVLETHIADARRFVRNSPVKYDVIIGDVFHPYRDGAGALYTREHFAAIRSRLGTNGLFCQWLPLHQFDERTLRVIVRTFQRVFPSAEAWLLRFNVDVPVVGLIGSTAEIPWRTNAAEQPAAGDARLAGELRRLGLADSLRLYGHFLADADDLRRFSDGASMNTDDDERVTFLAPRVAYQQNTKPYSSLLALMTGTRAAAPAHLAGDDSAFAQRFTRYLNARNVYLRGLIDAAENREQDAVVAYIESARISPDFTSGYAQCLSIVSIIANSDPARAKRILNDLIAAQPERPVAREMLDRMFAR